MKIIKDLEQNGEKWHSFRREGIGGSDIAILAGTSPYETPLGLYQLKLGLKPPPELDPFLIESGERAEIEARDYFKTRPQDPIEFIPICVISDENPIIRASLDGFNNDKNIVLEVKFMGNQKFKRFKKTKELNRYHLAQINWQLLVTKAEKAIYYVESFSGDFDHIEVFPDSQLQNNLKKLALDFWENHILKKVPPEEG
jgi:putative phage-type endonuclease